jgi:hypothetical protein
VAKWKSVANHMQNIHSGHDPLFHRCLHGRPDARTQWIEEGKPACITIHIVVTETVNCMVLLI